MKNKLNVSNIISKIKTLHYDYNGKYIVAKWGRDGRLDMNWGDALNPVLIKQLSGKEIIHREDIKRPKKKNTYFVIGSHLGTLKEKNSSVWGTGFSNYNDKLRVNPEQICAVRGPLTRKNILENGGSCPEIFGDPALLYPLFYKPKKKIIYKLGIIPHYREQDLPIIKKLMKLESISLIDVRIGINKFIDEISKCEFIASSSLHGVIAADAYGIPALRIKLSDRLDKSAFKFKDYFMSVNRDEKQTVTINNIDDLPKIFDNMKEKKYELDIVKLFHSCPFLSNPELKNLDFDLVFNRI